MKAGIAPPARDCARPRCSAGAPDRGERTRQPCCHPARPCAGALSPDRCARACEEARLPDERGWARRLRAGDVAALEEAFRTYYARLCSFVRQHVGSMDTAEELVQDVFLRVWQRRQLLDPAGSLRALLYRAAHNAALNHLKHRQIEHRWANAVQSAPEAVAPEAEAGVRERELAGAIQGAIGALPERCRLIFLMSRQQGLSYGEIADVLGLSVKTVETQMGRALKALRGALSQFLLA